MKLSLALAGAFVGTALAADLPIIATKVRNIGNCSCHTN